MNYAVRGDTLGVRGVPVFIVHVLDALAVHIGRDGMLARGHGIVDLASCVACPIVESGILEEIVAGQVEFPFVLVQAVDGRLLPGLGECYEFLHLVPFFGLQ